MVILIYYRSLIAMLLLIVKPFGSVRVTERLPSSENVPSTVRALQLVYLEFGLAKKLGTVNDVAPPAIFPFVTATAIVDPEAGMLPLPSSIK